MKNFVKEKWSDVVLGAVFVVSGFVKAVKFATSMQPFYSFFKKKVFIFAFEREGWMKIDARRKIYCLIKKTTNPIESEKN